jgi:hypothetical protein
MTPTEIKAIAKAHELIKMFSSTKTKKGAEGWGMPKEVAIAFALDACDQVLGVLNDMKGMAKIHKVKMWQLVRKNLENE